MEGGVLAKMFLFMVLWIASLSPSSCARTDCPRTNALRTDEDIAFDHWAEQVVSTASDPFNNHEYIDEISVAKPDTFDEYYKALANRQVGDDDIGLQAFPEARRKGTFNVMNYGAAGNGQVDDTQAFLRAWNDVCGSNHAASTVIIPKGNNFLLSSLVFEGPCRARTVNFQLNGRLVAPSNLNAWRDKEKWIQFMNVPGLIINGGGQIDGQGHVWWKACPNCQRPTALHIVKCPGLRLSDINHLNSARNHISIVACNDVIISNIAIRAPENSPNTDGIDISASTNINIRHSFIGTGDDCVAINTGSSHINITSVLCGPGHGISIGSLGKHGSYSTVEDVQVRHCIFRGTQNGARIKTWQGGSGYARHIIFDDIIMQNSQNPIIIDQKYSDNLLGFGPLSEQVNAVQVSDVTYSGIRGSVNGSLAITLDCDNRVGCTNIVMENIELRSSVRGQKTVAYCKNVHGSCSSATPSVPCF